MNNVKKLVFTAMFSTLAVVLGLIQIPTPFAPYLAIDASEIIVLITGNFFGLGMMSVVIVLRSLLRFALGLATGFFIVGELAAIISSLSLGIIFLGAKKLIAKKDDAFKINNSIMLVFLVLLIPFTYFMFKVENNSWLILGMITLFLPLVAYLIFTLAKKEPSKKYSKQIFSSSVAILSTSVIMTILNFFVITPSNALQKPALFTTLLTEFNLPMDAYIYGFILPLLPFNILKGIISVVIFYIIEKTIAKVINRA